MIRTYRKIAIISAEQFDGSDKQIKKYGILPPYPQDIGTITDEEWQPLLPTKDGLMTCHVGDWVATGINGEHWPISDDTFRKTYAELPVIPGYVADWIEECKRENISLSDMLCSERRPEQIRDWMAFTPGTYQFDYARYQKYQKLVARAWLDGYRLEEEHDAQSD